MQPPLAPTTDAIIPTPDDVRTSIAGRLDIHDLDDNDVHDLTLVYLSYADAHELTLARGRVWTFDEWLARLIGWTPKETTL